MPYHDALFIVCFVRSRYLVFVLSAHATYERNQRKLRTDFSLFTLRADVYMYVFICIQMPKRTHERTHVCVHMNDNDGNDADEGSARFPPPAA